MKNREAKNLPKLLEREERLKGMLVSGSQALILPVFIQRLRQNFDTANQRISGLAEFFQRFKLAATNSCRNSKFPRIIHAVSE